jgi:hypothetical protein
METANTHAPIKRTLAGYARLNSALAADAASVVEIVCGTNSRSFSAISRNGR